MKLYLLFGLMAIAVAAGTAADDLISDYAVNDLTDDYAVNVTEINDVIASIKANFLDLHNTTDGDVTVNPRAVLAERGPCNRRCRGAGAKPCCPKDTCFQNVCIGPHLGPREFPEAFNEYAKRELADVEVAADVDPMDSDADTVSLEKRDPKCRRRCTSHKQCCRSDLCIQGACLGRHEDHP
ncbi:hypothetical protein ATEIFO6365_0009026000 [Aspergillus terreus]|uniref:Uncharacterized protein n=1 Tax=Aspergillus terreus TaxID=33178 RepID=A0A5M3ZC73_ASPTE|nr:hypothetical protein ATETN484_0011026000 [Aspergillus terreus]GFF18897.1 hypothetical protein ATEIFO6365_0009026000 [Aspergillus terreus]